MAEGDDSELLDTLWVALSASLLVLPIWAMLTAVLVMAEGVGRDPEADALRVEVSPDGEVALVEAPTGPSVALAALESAGLLIALGAVVGAGWGVVWLAGRRRAAPVEADAVLSAEVSVRGARPVAVSVTAPSAGVETVAGRDVAPVAIDVPDDGVDRLFRAPRS